MSYGERLKNPSNRGETPPGRTSWEDAVNQVQGNLRWCLSFLDTGEVIKLLAEVVRSMYTGKAYRDSSERAIALRLRASFHEELAKLLYEKVEEVE